MAVFLAYFKASSHDQMLECSVLDESFRTGVHDITLITVNCTLYRSLFGVVHFFQPDLFISGFKYRVLHCLPKKQKYSILVVLM